MDVSERISVARTWQYKLIFHTTTLNWPTPPVVVQFCGPYQITSSLLIFAVAMLNDTRHLPLNRFASLTNSPRPCKWWHSSATLRTISQTGTSWFLSHPVRQGKRCSRLSEDCIRLKPGCAGSSSPRLCTVTNSTYHCTDCGFCQLASYLWVTTLPNDPTYDCIAWRFLLLVALPFVNAKMFQNVWGLYSSQAGLCGLIFSEAMYSDRLHLPLYRFVDLTN